MCTAALAESARAARTDASAAAISCWYVVVSSSARTSLARTVSPTRTESVLTFASRRAERSIDCPTSTPVHASSSIVITALAVGRAGAWNDGFAEAVGSIGARPLAEIAAAGRLGGDFDDADAIFAPT